MPVGATRNTQTQKIAIRIDEVDIPNRVVHGYDKSNVLVVATFRATPHGVLQVPAQNERWICERQGMGQWHLTHRLDSADQQAWVEAHMKPGDMRLTGDPVWIQGTEFFPNGPQFLNADGRWTWPSQSSLAILSLSPKLYWPLDDPAGSTTALDHSGNGYNGTPGSAATFGNPGHLIGDPRTSVYLPPTGLSLGAGNSIVAGPSTFEPFVIGSSYTYAGWMDAPDAPGMTPAQSPVMFGQPKMGWVYLWVGGNSDIHFSPNETLTWALGYAGKSNVQTHWALTYDDATKTAELFINGSSLGTRTSAQGYTGMYASGGGNDAFGIGTTDGAGYMQDVAVYDRILTPTQIQLLYNSGLGPSGGGGGAVSSVFSRVGAVVAQTGDYTVSQVTGAAALASPTFTGTPAAPTPATADNSTTLATTAFVKAQGYVTAATSPVTSVFSRTGAVTAQTGDYTVAQVTGAAPLASPTFTGTPAAPTPLNSDNSTTIATTAFVKNQGYLTSVPVTSVFSRTGAVVAQTGDYTVSQITGAAPLASPTFTGTPAAPTPLTADNSTTIATTAFVKAQGYVTATTAPVTSVFSRTGAVVAATGDYSLTQINKGTQHRLVISGATTLSDFAAGTSGQLLQSAGSAADPAWTTSTYPGTAGGIGHVPRSDGTNYVDAQLAATDLSNGTVGLGNIVLANGPALTNPTATTQAAGDNSTKVATTAFVTSAITAAGPNIYTIAQTSHGFTVGQILLYNGTAYALALADNAADAEVIGIVASVVDANHFTLQVGGEITTLSGLTAGTTYFLSDATAGLLTATQPTTIGHISKPLGVAVSTTALYFFNMRGELISPVPSAPKVTTSAFSAGPPSGASDGDIWIASAVDSNGTRWQFQYNAGSASPYKWEFIGGPPVFNVVDTSETTTVAWGSKTDLATVGPFHTFVRSGDYAFLFTARCHNNTANVGIVTTLTYGAPTVGGTPTGFDGDTAVATSATASAEAMVTGQTVLVAQAAGTTAKLQYSTLTTGTGTWSQRRLFVTPVRVS